MVSMRWRKGIICIKVMNSSSSFELLMQMDQQARKDVILWVRKLSGE